MDFIKPIQTEIITTITKAWQCTKCDKTFIKEEEAEAHYADTHSAKRIEWLGGESAFLFENEYDFAFWKQNGIYRHSGGCGGAWEGAGWYTIVWRGDREYEYPVLEPAWETLNRDLENAKYHYDQTRERIETFKKILAS